MSKQRYYIHKHEVAQAYGGPEEGGWWYDTGEPVEGWIPEVFENEEDFYARCRELNAQERDRAEQEEDYGYTSVLSHRSTHYSYGHGHESSIPRPYPEHRPHYE